jgi:uncharacterized protein
VTRSRVIAADPQRVWSLVSDPHSLPRWWPRAMRVEDVRGEGTQTRWTAVLETERGTGVRADFRCVASRPGEVYAWEQDIEGTPFERILRRAAIAIDLEADPGGTRVALTSDETLRGLARLGSTMMRGAARRRLDEALAGIERALVDHGGA